MTTNLQFVEVPYYLEISTKQSAFYCHLAEIDEKVPVALRQGLLAMT